MYSLNYLKKYEILSQVEVCAMLGITRTSLWRYTKTRGLPVHKPQGARPFYLKTEVLNWLKEQNKPNLVERSVNLDSDGFKHR